MWGSVLATVWGWGGDRENSQTVDTQGNAGGTQGVGGVYWKVSGMPWGRLDTHNEPKEY